MKIKQSPLELFDLAIVNFNYGLNPEDITGDIQDLFSSYDIDMDFAVRTDVEDLIRILVKVTINRPKDEPAKAGYNLFAEAMGLYKFSEADKQSEDKDKLKNIVNSGLAMTISYLRTFIAGVTGHFPLGKYWVPSIDLNAMVKMKADIKNSNKEAPPKSRITAKRKKKE